MRLAAPLALTVSGSGPPSFSSCFSASRCTTRSARSNSTAPGLDSGSAFESWSLKRHLLVAGLPVFRTRQRYPDRERGGVGGPPPPSWRISLLAIAVSGRESHPGRERFAAQS